MKMTKRKYLNPEMEVIVIHPDSILNSSVTSVQGSFNDANSGTNGSNNGGTGVAPLENGIWSWTD